VSWRYLSEEDIIHINERVTQAADMLTQPLLLRSAVHRQWAGYGDDELYPSVQEKAGALFHGLCSNHAFMDGNKRTAFEAADAFCRFNGAKIVASTEQIVALGVDTAAESLTVEVVIARFASLVVSNR
jgi:death on curing protein